MSIEPPPAFAHLISDFCQAMNLPADPEALGLAFEADGHVVEVSPDPRSQLRLLAQVQVGAEQPWPQDLAALLHPLNHAARLEHDWVASLDPEGQLWLHTQRELAQTTATELEGLLADGVERAQALASLLEAGQAQAASPDAADFDPRAGGMLRG